MPQLPACSYPAAVNILHFLRGHEQVKQQASMTGYPPQIWCLVSLCMLGYVNRYPGAAH